MLDIVIRSGMVIDGTGAAARRADVAISNGVIVEVGIVQEQGRTEIDAAGLVVTPGFIDAHTHLDAQLLWDPYGGCSSYHGVTTVITGNCGFTLAPVRPDERSLVVTNLQRAEDIDPRALAEGLSWGWSDFASYLDVLDTTPKALNCAANVGHSALRTWAMGKEAFQRESNDDELDAMRRELRRALDAGAIGLSTSRNANHATADDFPVASRLASWSELRSLTAELARTPGRMLEFAPEEPDHDTGTRAEILDRWSDLVLDTGVPASFGLLATPDIAEPALTALERVARHGGRLIGQTHARGIHVLLSFRTRLPFDILPEWRELRACPLGEQQRRLRDPEVRRRLENAAEHGDYTWGTTGAMPRRPDYEGLRVYRNGLPPNPSVADIARDRGVRPITALIDLALETDMAQIFQQPSRNPQDPELLSRALRHDRTVMTFSDSGAHLSQIADASIHTHFLGHTVRVLQWLTLEAAVHKITGQIAQEWGLHDRGRIAVGTAADCNIIDPERLGPCAPEYLADLPGGGLRLVQRAVGIHTTVVNGAITFADGRPTGALPGRLLRAS